MPPQDEILPENKVDILFTLINCEKNITWTHGTVPSEKSNTPTISSPSL